MGIRWPFIFKVNGNHEITAHNERENNFLPHQDLNHGPLELKASVLPMSCTDADITMFLIAEISKIIKIVKSVKLYGWIW